MPLSRLISSLAGVRWRKLIDFEHLPKEVLEVLKAPGNRIAKTYILQQHLPNAHEDELQGMVDGHSGLGANESTPEYVAAHAGGKKLKE